MISGEPDQRVQSDLRWGGLQGLVTKSSRLVRNLLPKWLCRLQSDYWRGGLSQIPNLESEFFPSRIRIFFHTGSALKNLSILTQKIVYKLLRNWIWIVHPGSGSWFVTHPGSQIQGSKGHRILDPDPQHLPLSLRVHYVQMRWRRASVWWVSVRCTVGAPPWPSATTG